MRKNGIGALLLLFALAQQVSGQTTEIIGDFSQPYRVTYADGETERYIAQYTGKVIHRIWESGGPAMPLEGRFADDRQCHWTIQSLIDRQIALTNRAGEQFVRPNLTRVYGVSLENQGSDFILTQLSSENCGQARGRYESDLNNARNAVSAALQSAANSDQAAVQQQLRTDTGSQNVELRSTQ